MTQEDKKWLYAMQLLQKCETAITAQFPVCPSVPKQYKASWVETRP